MLRLELPLPDPLLSPNSYGHWAPKAKAVREAKDMVVCAVLEQGHRTEPLTHATVTVSFVLPNRRRRDHGNLIASAKAYLDGLTLAGIISDDDLTHIDEKYPKPTVEKGISMTVIEVE